MKNIEIAGFAADLFERDNSRFDRAHFLAVVRGERPVDSRPLLNTRSQSKLPSYQELERLYRDGKATMPVDHINHREVVYKGVRYFVGWSSEKTLLPSVDYPVVGWIVYKSQTEV